MEVLLFGDTAVTDAGLAVLAGMASPPPLESLAVGGCVGVVDAESVAAVVRVLHRTLRRLMLDGCVWANSAVASTLAALYPGGRLRIKI